MARKVDNVEFAKNLIEKVSAGVKEENRRDDGSVEVRLTTEDIKNGLNIKVLRKDTKQKLQEDLQTCGLAVEACPTAVIRVTIPKDQLQCDVIDYKDL